MLIILLAISCNENIIQKDPNSLSDDSAVTEVDDSDTDTQEEEEEEEEEVPQPGGFPIPTEMAYVHTANQLYSWSDVGFNDIGTFTLSDGSTPSINDIAINSAGAVYAVSSTAIYRVNVQTASLEQTGSLSQPINGLGFDQNDSLYAIGNGLHIINTDTNRLIPIPLDIELHSPGDIIGLSDGVLLSCMDNPNIENGNTLVQISPNTGTAQTLEELDIEAFTGLANIANTYIVAFNGGGEFLLIDLVNGGVDLFSAEVMNITGATGNPLFQ